jgi:hypothetical protein
MEKKRRFFSRFTLIIFILLLTLIGSLTLHYFVNKKNFLTFIPNKFFLYAKTPTLKTIYEEYLSLTVINNVLSLSELKETRTLIYSLKRNELLKNFFFKQILNLPVNIIFEDEKNSLFLFDLGWRSIFTRILPFIGYNINLKNLTITKKEGFVIFQYELSPGLNLYFSFVDNILLFSFNIETIQNAYEISKGKENFNYKKPEKIVNEFAKTEKNFKILVSLEKLLASSIITDNTIHKVLKKFDPLEDILITATIEETNINLEARLSTSSISDENLKSLLLSKSAYLNSLRFLPQDITLVTILNTVDLKDFIQFLDRLEIKEISENLKNADSTIKTVFGKDLNEMVFSWTGGETGLCKIRLFNDPVVFLKIKNREKYEEFKKTVINNLIISSSTQTVYGVEINLFKMIDFLSWILEIFKIKIPVAYYIEFGNYFFFSTNPENLATIVKNYREKNTFTENKENKTVLRNLKPNTFLFSYFDVEKEKINFLKEESILSMILRQYELASISFYNTEDAIYLKISTTTK